MRETLWSARVGDLNLLRIRRLGVRIPSGALCVETEKQAPTSGNAGRGFFAYLVVPLWWSNNGPNNGARVVWGLFELDRAGRFASLT